MHREKKREDFEAYKFGRDELNLAEFPLAGIADRFLKGEKTVVFNDQVWDPDKKLHLPRELAISGSDRYGLPTAKDDDVLLACVQLSSLAEFHSREVSFSRYSLLRLLRWPEEGKSYRRLLLSLRRWKGVTVYSNRAFYDHARKSWINRDFGILDNLYVYEREEHSTNRAQSWFVWNEVIFESFRAGYLKTIDWDLYCRLTDPVAKRLYRFLDKRFYRSDRLVIDLRELAVNKVRLSPHYNAAQIKRALKNGIRELETFWHLREMEPSQRFQKVKQGEWQAVFERAKPKGVGRVPGRPPADRLQSKLAARGIRPGVAAKLVTEHSTERILSSLALFDWHSERGNEKSPGFLVAGIRDSEGYTLPEGVKPKDEANERRSIRPERQTPPVREKLERRNPRKASPDASEFAQFWGALSAEEQAAFETEAVDLAAPLKRAGFLRTRDDGGSVFSHYRESILLDHFIRRRKTAPAS